MKVTLVPGNRLLEVRGNRPARDILKELNILPEAHLVVRNGELITEDEVVKEEDQVTIVSAISGGRP